jgi:hypothetical protein
MAKLLLLKHFDLVEDIKSDICHILVRFLIDAFNNLLDVKIGGTHQMYRDIKRKLTQITIICSEYTTYICLLCQKDKDSQDKRKITYAVYRHNIIYDHYTHYMCKSCIDINKLLQI